MKRVAGLTAVTAVVVGLLVSTAVETTAAAPPTALTTATPSTSVAATMDGAKFRPRARFAREFIKKGAVDSSVYDIDHVRELQYRLRWLGIYDGSVNGRFDGGVARAVKRFQKRNHLRVSGAANIETWAELIPKTVRAKRNIPRRCKRRNVEWHVCYDRAHHQATLWHKKVLWNSWLVRGGSSSAKTRLGTNYVFSRDKDHVSGIFGSPMPYSQFFDGGQALHGSRTMIDPFYGHSHGCVNMYVEDARQLWKVTTRDPMSEMKVTVYGAWS